MAIEHPKRGGEEQWRGCLGSKSIAAFSGGSSLEGKKEDYEFMMRICGRQDHFVAWRRKSGTCREERKILENAK